MDADKIKARKIVEEHGSFLNKGRDMRDDITRAVEKGIALGRREGLLAASQAIADALSTLPPEKA